MSFIAGTKDHKITEKLVPFDCSRLTCSIPLYTLFFVPCRRTNIRRRRTIVPRRGTIVRRRGTKDASEGNQECFGKELTMFQWIKHYAPMEKKAYIGAPF